MFKVVHHLLVTPTVKPEKAMLVALSLILSSVNDAARKAIAEKIIIVTK